MSKAKTLRRRLSSKLKPNKDKTSEAGDDDEHDAPDSVFAKKLMLMAKIMQSWKKAGRRPTPVVSHMILRTGILQAVFRALRTIHLDDSAVSLVGAAALQWVVAALQSSQTCDLVLLTFATLESYHGLAGSMEPYDVSQYVNTPQPSLAAVLMKRLQAVETDKKSWHRAKKDKASPAKNSTQAFLGQARTVAEQIRVCFGDLLATDLALKGHREISSSMQAVTEQWKAWTEVEVYSEDGMPGFKYTNQVTFVDTRTFMNGFRKNAVTSQALMQIYQEEVFNRLLCNVQNPASWPANFVVRYANNRPDLLRILVSPAGGIHQGGLYEMHAIVPWDYPKRRVHVYLGGSDDTILSQAVKDDTWGESKFYSGLGGRAAWRRFDASLRAVEVFWC